MATDTWTLLGKRPTEDRCVPRMTAALSRQCRLTVALARGYSARHGCGRHCRFGPLTLQAVNAIRNGVRWHLQVGSSRLARFMWGLFSVIQSSGRPWYGADGSR